MVQCQPVFFYVLGKCGKSGAYNDLNHTNESKEQENYMTSITFMQ